MIEVVLLYRHGGTRVITAELETTATRERILDAAERCLRQLGLRRVSMGDVAIQAGVSRGSVYRYFPDRSSLLDAVLERTAERFVTGSTATVDRRRTLAGQVGEAAVFILQHREDDNLLTGEESLLATLLSVQVHGLLERWVEFWLPRLADAAARGEVRTDLDHRQAAEWIVRLMLSFAVMPSVTVDLDDADAVRTFVRNHLVHGLAPREGS
jgi:AcrR family transcriptional regulator